MKTIKRFIATQDEAIKNAKKRASSRYRTQYIYRTNPDPGGTAEFYIRELLDKKQPPILKVLYDGSVVSLEESPT